MAQNLGARQLMEDEYRNPSRRKDEKGLFVDLSKLPTISKATLPTISEVTFDA
jgi:hypothetical protein